MCLWNFIGQVSKSQIFLKCQISVDVSLLIDRIQFIQVSCIPDHMAIVLNIDVKFCVGCNCWFGLGCDYIQCFRFRISAIHPVRGVSSYVVSLWYDECTCCSLLVNAVVHHHLHMALLLIMIAFEVFDQILSFRIEFSFIAFQVAIRCLCVLIIFIFFLPHQLL